MASVGRAEHVAALRALLRRDWDPIGIADAPATQDEYDTYADDVAQRLNEGATLPEIESCLRAIVRERMRMDNDPADYPALMSKIAALRSGD
jgi:hypothetical protein